MLCSSHFPHTQITGRARGFSLFSSEHCCHWAGKVTFAKLCSAQPGVVDVGGVRYIKNVTRTCEALWLFPPTDQGHGVKKMDHMTWVSKIFCCCYCCKVWLDCLLFTFLSRWFVVLNEPSSFIEFSSSFVTVCSYGGMGRQAAGCVCRSLTLHLRSTDHGCNSQQDHQKKIMHFFPYKITSIYYLLS